MELLHPTSAPTATPAHCDECHAPVEETQRYCVVCGAHRRHVEDPAARYLSQQSAQTRRTRAPGGARRQPANRNLGLGIAVALALIPVAAVVGVLEGRSSNNGDAHLIRVLSQERAAAAGTSSTASAAPATSLSGQSTSSTTRRVHRTAGHDARHAHAHGRHAARASKPTTTGAAPISTAPPSAAAKKTGAAATQKVQKSTGKNYVTGQKSLPGTVVVP